MKTALRQWLKRNFTDPEAVFLSVSLIIFFLVFMTMGRVLFPIIASMIIAYLLNSFVVFLERCRLPRPFSVYFVFSIFVGFLVIILIWLCPLLFQQLSNLFTEAPHMLMRGQRFLLNLQASNPEFFSQKHISNIISEFSRDISVFGQFILSLSLASITNVLTLVIYLVLVPLLAFFFLKDKEQIKNWLRRFLPKKHQNISKIFTDIDQKTTKYISGRLLEIIIITIVCLTAFWLIGLNFAVLLSVCVGISAIIPYVGAILVTIPIVIIAFLQWGFTDHLAYLLVIYAIIIASDANILVPLLFSNRMQLHPVAIIIALLVFGYLWGFWGVFFAIPLATVVNTLISNWPQVSRSIE
jgi:putative permease